MLVVGQIAVLVDGRQILVVLLVPKDIEGLVALIACSYARPVEMK